MANPVSPLGKYVPEVIPFVMDHNPYETKIFCKNKTYKKTIIFIIFHYKEEAQYKDLLEPILDKGYRIITVSFLHSGDKVLSLNYYYNLLTSYYRDVVIKNELVKSEEVIFMGVGVGANLIAYGSQNNLKSSKNILISPVNTYKDEFAISDIIGDINTPTYIMYGQFDKENSVDSRYEVFKKGRRNSNVHFSTYACTGHYCYYERFTSLALDSLYHKNSIDCLVGSDRRNQPLFLPTESKINSLFYRDLFDIIENKKSKKRILLLTETFPMYACGKGTSIEFLRKELSKLGYDAYLTGLWRKYDDFSSLPDFYIPLPNMNTRVVDKNKNYVVFAGTNIMKEAKMLTTFGFDYLHLYTSFQVGKIGLELSKMTGITMPFTYHTLWHLYYKKKINNFIKDTSSSKRIAFSFSRSKVFKESPYIITQSKKSAQILDKKVKGTKNISVITTPMNTDSFFFNKSDAINVEILRKEHNLKKKKVIGYINKVSPEINTYEIISYFSKLVPEYKDLVLMIVGTGKASDKLLKFAKKCGVENKVIFVHSVSDEERKWYLHLFDVFVSGSDFELQGSPYFEAAYSGTPIVAKQNECTEDLFKDGENAYIYSSFEEFTRGIELALNGKNKAVVNSAKDLSKKCSPEKWAKQMLKIYIDINKRK